jgi:glycosyltransferase involved in cell wall biosynthesis
MGVARSLSEANLLQRFVTTVTTGNGHDPAGFKYLPKGLRDKLSDQLKRRQVPDFLDVQVETVQFPEMVNLAARRFGVGEVRRHRIWEWAETTFDHTVAGRWAGKAPCIYGCEHASVETFRKQKEAGGYNILWQVIAHHQTMTRLLREELDAFPATTTPYQRELFATLPRINARKDKQYADADLIVTNSEFARQTFIEAGLSADKVRSAQTGCPPVLSGAIEERQSAPMIFLSAGSQSVRKGIPYLLEAWRRLQPVAGAELWLVGQMELPPGLLKNLPANVIIKPPVARDELETILRRASVLVLPTLGEGLAHIVLEALSAGLAIVTTENSGCGDLVEDGVNGWKIPIRDSDALSDRISWCLDHPSEVAEMQRQSQRRAAGWQQEHFVAFHTKIIKAFLADKEISELEQRWAPAYAG